MQSISVTYHNGTVETFPGYLGHKVDSGILEIGTTNETIYIPLGVVRHWKVRQREN